MSVLERFRQGVLVTTTVATVGALAVAGASTEADAYPNPYGTPTIIQLGDSFASGEGGGWKGNSLDNGGNRSGTDMARLWTGSGWYFSPSSVYRTPSWGDDCHESVHAPITWVAERSPSVGKVVNLACSGATNKNLWPATNGGQAQNGRQPQISRIPGSIGVLDDVKLIAVSAGGNDSGFGNAVRGCITAWAKKHLGDIAFSHPDSMCRDEIRNSTETIQDTYYNLTKTIDLVRQTMAAEGESPDEYRIVLEGYPMILPTSTDDWIGNEGQGLDKRCPVTKDDSAWINEHFVTRLNDMVKAAADDKGVGYLDLTDAFVGHRLCEYGTVRGAAASSSSNDAEWVRFVDVHPTVSDTLQLLLDLALPNGAGLPLTDDEIADVANFQRHLSESMHPNYWGQRAIGTCLSKYYANTSGAAKVKCTNGGGQHGSTEQMTIANLPATPTYTDNPNPDKAIPEGGVLTAERSISVPSNVPPGQYVQVKVDIDHPRKGQLKVYLRPPNGARPSSGVFTLRTYNPVDTGAWVDGTWTFDYYSFDPWLTKDPSGTWTLVVTDSTGDAYDGTLKSWQLRFY